MVNKTMLSSTQTHNRDSISLHFYSCRYIKNSSGKHREKMAFFLLLSYFKMIKKKKKRGGEAEMCGIEKPHNLINKRRIKFCFSEN